MRDIENLNKVSNFRESSEREGKIDEFKEVEKRFEKLEETLHPTAAGGEERVNNFFVYAILFALRFDVPEKLDVWNEKELQETISENLFLKLFENKDKFKLELENHEFNLQYMEINEILAASSNFLRVYEFQKSSDIGA